MRVSVQLILLVIQTYGLESESSRNPSPQMDKELADRLEKLETNLAHLDHQYDQLNQVVLEQSRQLTKLLALQQKLSETMENIESERIRSTNPKPPHYSA